MALTFSANQLRVIATMLPCDLAGASVAQHSKKVVFGLKPTVFKTYGLHKHFSNVIFLQFPMEFAPVTFPPPRTIRARLENAHEKGVLQIPFCCQHEAYKGLFTLVSLRSTPIDGEFDLEFRRFICTREKYGTTGRSTSAFLASRPVS